MPMYEYECGKCKKKFELLRGLSERDEKCTCPHCNTEAEMKRLSSLFSAGGSGDGVLSGSCSTSSSGIG